MTGSQWRRPFGPGAQPPVSPELRGYDNALLLNACRALTLPGSFLSSPHRVSPQLQEAGVLILRTRNQGSEKQGTCPTPTYLHPGQRGKAI